MGPEIEGFAAVRFCFRLLVSDDTTGKPMVTQIMLRTHEGCSIEKKSSIYYSLDQIKCLKQFK